MISMQDYIDRAVTEAEEALRHESKGKEKLSHSEKQLIEYGYKTAALDMAWEIHQEGTQESSYIYENKDGKCECGKCEKGNCPYRDKYQRLPRTSSGALGLCPKLKK